MNTRRVQHLIDILLARPEQDPNFDISLYISYSRPCGTVACAAGWAALDPEFMAEGFEFGQDKSTIYYADKDGFEALLAFFGLSEEQTHMTFYQSGYPGPKPVGPHDVARRLQEFLAA